ncbi:MAG TPA: CDP-alcohol phosphatidyltransferase family protein [Candidatus Limnocylindria bacterium]|nr:CDP-alcohol phosphatidyltransferase family protein [Candidatus Limnocylindria bacterium]
MSVVPRRLAGAFRGTLAPAAGRLHSLGVRANTVTVIGAALTVLGAALLATAQPGPALAVLLLGTLCDTLDGQLARAAGGGTRFGAFLDSTLDRLSDAALAIAAVQLGATLPDPVLYGDGLVLLVASFLVSYIRAKAESLGEGASVGVAPREARIAI